MYKVGLVTNWHENCAVAEYAKNLAHNLVRLSGLELKIVTGDICYEGVEAQTKDVDIIHFNYCRHAFSHMDPQLFNTFRGKGKPVILTFHESSDWQTRRLASTPLADWVVVHDKLRDGPPAPENVRHIPFGVQVVDTSDVVVQKKVGTFGCAFPWKGLYPLAWACGQLDVPLTAILSEADPDKGDINWPLVKREVMEMCPLAGIITGWRPQEEIIRRLAECAVIALPFDPHSPITGISASVRFALAAKRPIVLTRFAHFSDLYDYEDEVYFVDEDLKRTLNMALIEVENGWERKPEKILEDMSWPVVARHYLNLYEESLRSKVTFYKKEEINAG